MGPVNWLMNKEGQDSSRRLGSLQNIGQVGGNGVEESWWQAVKPYTIYRDPVPYNTVGKAMKRMDNLPIGYKPNIMLEQEFDSEVSKTQPAATPTAQNVSQKPDPGTQASTSEAEAAAARALGVPVSAPAVAARANVNTGIQGIGNFMGNAAGMIGSFLGGRAPQQQQPAKPAPATRPPAKPNAAPVPGAKPTDSAKTLDWKNPYANASNDTLDAASKAMDDDMGANLVSKENNTPRGTQARIMNDAWNKADKVAPPQIEKRTQTNANAERAAGTPFRQPRMQP